jgi:hypothetical protein
MDAGDHLADAWVQRQDQKRAAGEALTTISAPVFCILMLCSFWRVQLYLREKLSQWRNSSNDSINDCLWDFEPIKDSHKILGNVVKMFLIQAKISYQAWMRIADLSACVISGATLAEGVSHEIKLVPFKRFQVRTLKEPWQSLIGDCCFVEFVNNSGQRRIPIDI